jgi:hypothetical protein
MIRNPVVANDRLSLIERVQSNLRWRLCSGHVITQTLADLRASHSFVPGCGPAMNELRSPAADPVYLSRIPKTASTTALKALNQLPAGVRTCEVPWPDSLRLTLVGELMDCHILTGHLAATPTTMFPWRKWRLITVLRDPLVRLVSQWQQLRLEGNLRYAGEARHRAVQLDLVPWLRWALDYFADFNDQARWLTLPSDREPTNDRWSFVTDGHAHLDARHVPPPQLRARAIEAIADALAVGPCSAATEVISHGLRVNFGCQFNAEHKLENQSQLSSEHLASTIPVALAKELLERSAIDVELVHLATDIYTNKIRTRGTE